MNTQKRHKAPARPCVILEPVEGNQMPKWFQGLTTASWRNNTPPIVPEIQLLYAVVERAWFDLTLTDRNTQRNAAKWVLSHDRSPWSFLWICEHLRLSTKTLRRIYKMAQTAKERALLKDATLSES